MARGTHPQRQGQSHRAAVSAWPQPRPPPFSQLQQLLRGHQPEPRHLRRAVPGSLWVCVLLQALGCHGMSGSRCRPSCPRRPGSGFTPTSPGGEQLGLGRKPLPVCVSTISDRGCVPFLQLTRLFWAWASALGEGSPGPSWAPKRGPSSEAVGSLPKVTLPFAFLENGKVWLC